MIAMPLPDLSVGFQPEPVIQAAAAAQVAKQEGQVATLDNNQNVVWAPIPGTSQELALSSPCDITFFDGPRGPGKTIAQIMYYRQFVGLGYGSYWRGIIFDREHDNLADLVAQSKRVFPKFDDGAKFKESKGDYKWTWPSGEELMFRHVKKPEDYNGFHGWEIPFLGWNEITKYATRFLYDKFMSINRSSFDPEKDTPKVKQGNRWVYATHDGKPLPPIPLKVFVTTNPNGPGHNWCKEEFVDPAPPGQILRQRVELYDDLKDETVVVEKTQVRIFGNFFENPYIPHAYRAKILSMCERDPNLKAAWIFGDWSVNAGGAIDDCWRDAVHIRDPFIIPKEWKIDRAHDWGSTTPFGTTWWAESNGEEFELLDGSTWCVPRGTLFCIAEDYGTIKIGTNQGLKLSAKDVALRTKAVDKRLLSERWIRTEVRPGPADNSIRNVNPTNPQDTIETAMLDQGIVWEESDKSPGSRINGLQLLRDRLQASVVGEGPGIYFFRTCKGCIKTLPPLPRDEDKPDDVDTDAEDHLYDSVRYRVLKSANRYATDLKVEWN